MPPDAGENPSQPPEQEQNGDGSEIVKSIKAKQLWLVELDERINEIVKDVPEGEKDRLSQAAFGLEAGELTGEELLAQFPGESNTQKLAEIIVAGVGIKKEVEQLEEQHKPYKIQELAQIAEDLTDRFYWDHFLEYYNQYSYYNAYRNDWDNGSMANGLSTVATLREVQCIEKAGALAEVPYEQLDNYQSTIQESALEWEKRGFLAKEPHPIQEPSMEQIRQRRLELRRELFREQEEMQEYARLKKLYRKFDRSYEFEDYPFEEVIRSLNTEEGYGYAGDVWQKYEYDPRYIDAVERFADKRRRRLVEIDVLPMSEEESEPYMERLRAVNVDSTLAQIKMEGFEEKEGETLVVTEEELRREFKTLVPACFLTKIEIVIVTEKPKKPDPNNPNIVTLGTFIPTYDSVGDLVSSRIEIYVSPSVPANTDSSTKKRIEDSFNSAALHEVAHRIHQELSFSDMQAWEEIIREDNTEVTAYVGRSRKKGATSSIVEDFCESYQMNALDTIRLYTVSPKRYFYMMDLRDRYMGDEQRKAAIKEIEKKYEEYRQERDLVFAQAKKTDGGK